MNSLFISRKQLSQELGVSLSTISRGVKKNKWPFTEFVKIGSQIRYPASLLQEIKDKSKERGGAGNGL
jgi:predicted DNA-binding transcriptional regulator AlpA